MKNFNFYRDEKATMWRRAKFSIQAENYDEAIKKVQTMEENTDNYLDVDFDWEDLLDTTDYLTPEENGGNPTIEVYEEENDELIYHN